VRLNLKNSQGKKGWQHYSRGRASMRPQSLQKRKTKNRNIKQKGTDYPFLKLFLLVFSVGSNGYPQKAMTNIRDKDERKEGREGKREGARREVGAHPCLLRHYSQ
jgi:hypothetical protein